LTTEYGGSSTEGNKRVITATIPASAGGAMDTQIPHEKRTAPEGTTRGEVPKGIVSTVVKGGKGRSASLEK